MWPCSPRLKPPPSACALAAAQPVLLPLNVALARVSVLTAAAHGPRQRAAVSYRRYCSFSVTLVSVSDSVRQNRTTRARAGARAGLPAAPRLSVTPLMLTGAFCGAATRHDIEKMRELPLPLIVRLAAPGPAILRLFAMAISPLVSVNVPVAVMLMVSPAAAASHGCPQAASAAVGQ